MSYALKKDHCEDDIKHHSPEKANTQLHQKHEDFTNNNNKRENVNHILESLEMVVWSATYPDLILTQISNSCQSIFSLEPGKKITILGILEQYVHPEDIHLVKEAAKQRELKGASSIEYRIIPNDGNIRMVHDYSRMVFDNDKNPIRVNGVITDISDSKYYDQEYQDKRPMHISHDDSDLKDIDKLELADIIDHESLQSLMDKFYELTHIGVGIIDLKGNVLVGTGWQDLCSKFHRAHPETCRNCIESDLELSGNVDPGTYRSYKCKNNMWDIATPIMVDEKHIGNLFLGQFFFEEEEIPFDTFRLQARKYGFEEKEYMEALNKVPRWSHETVNAVMNFYTQLTDIISSLCYSNILLARTLDERHKAEKRLAEETTRKRIFFEQSNDGIVVMGKNGRVLEANQKFADMLGYTLEELKQMYVWEWETLWTRDEIQERFFKDPFSAVNPVKHLRLETQHRRKDGSIYDVEIRTNAVMENGQEMHFSVCRDITKTKKIERKLKENKEKLSLAMGASGLGFWDLDIDTDQLYLSHEIYKLIGYETKDSTSPFHENIINFLHPDDIESLFDAIEESTATRKPIFMDLRVKHTSGEIKWTSLRGKPINIDENGRPHRIIGTLIDITTRVNAEKTLLYARAAADESNRMKTEMIQNISHELRTPLISILGFSDILLSNSDNFTEKQKKFLQNIHESGNNLDDLIEKFLDLVHVEDEGMDTLNQENVKLDKIINDTCNLLSRKALKKNINLDTIIDNELNTIVADPYKLRTILFNLIENAIKFTDPGGLVKIETKVNNNDVLISVTDTGIGIEKEKIGYIFEAFVQIDGSNTRKYGGAGLGLALVKRLVEVHNGHIQVESKPGKGSIFTFSIPLKVPENSDHHIIV